MSLQRSIWYRSEQYAKVSLETASKLSSVGFGVNSRETLPTALCCLSFSVSSFLSVKQVLWSTWPHLPNVVLKTKGLEVTSTKPYDTKRVLETWQLFVPLRFEPAQYVSSESLLFMGNRSFQIYTRPVFCISNFVVLNGVFLEIRWLQKTVLLESPAPEKKGQGRFWGSRLCFEAVHMVPSEMAPFPAFEPWPQKDPITVVSASVMAI